ncbi:MAG: hypothetical protein WC349_01935 [Patescibacteria group bacterium]|jgi:hypothetical protein
MDEKNFANNIINIEDLKVEKVKNSFESNYEDYKKLGGIINEGDYERILNKARESKILDEKNSEIRSTIRQGEVIAEFAKISLNNSEDNPDSKIVLYVLLRTDPIPEGKQNHHGQMSDQKLFSEAVRMTGDADALNKLIAAYPNIFKHEVARPGQHPEIQQAA